MLLKSPKNKGDSYERELAQYFNDNVPAINNSASRRMLSGGGRAEGLADLVGVRVGRTEFHIEAKRVEKLNFWRAMEQAITNSRHEIAANPDSRTTLRGIPIVINRRNKIRTEDSLCTLRLKDLIILINDSLQES
tara:strand:- start:411 stop:815 length:405 start_codon:yes stop_codon:yes gene_type:complete